MADDPSRAVRNPQEVVDDSEACLPRLPSLGANDSISSAISESRRLIEESYRVLVESRKVTPTRD